MINLCQKCSHNIAVAAKLSQRHLLQVKNQVLKVPVATKLTVYERYAGERQSLTLRERFEHGRKHAIPEYTKLLHEMKEKVICDQNLNLEHGDFEYFWKSDGPDSIENLRVTTDKDNDQGFSTAEVVLSKQNKALFRGHLTSQLPEDGITRRSGWVNLKWPDNYKSFFRRIPYNWDPFTHVVIKVRGDGRQYRLMMQPLQYYDISWHNRYSYPLYTRGGPYWQIETIPFSKFFYSHKGRIQDRQISMDMRNVQNISITAVTNEEGPFSLEIDFIALLIDENHHEEFAYELYRLAPGTATN